MPQQTETITCDLTTLQVGDEVTISEFTSNGVRQCTDTTVTYVLHLTNGKVMIKTEATGSKRMISNCDYVEITPRTGSIFTPQQQHLPLKQAQIAPVLAEISQPI